jgi:hypothetical protein
MEFSKVNGLYKAVIEFGLSEKISEIRKNEYQLKEARKFDLELWC